MLSGETADIYFVRTKEILEREGLNPIVTMEVFSRQDGILCGMHEVLNLLSQGYTNSAIAGTLFIDIKTVEHHLNSIYSKLKADPDYGNKHLRVSAARLYLETMGDLTSKESLLAAGRAG